MNVWEQEFDRQASLAGWESLKQGWPDRLLVNRETGELFFVEIKHVHASRNNDRPWVEQERLLRLLEKAGLKVRIALQGRMDLLLTIDEYVSGKWRKKAYLGKFNKLRAKESEQLEDWEKQLKEE